MRGNGSSPKGPEWKSSESRISTKSVELDLMRVKSAAAAAIAGATSALAAVVLHQVM